MTHTQAPAGIPRRFIAFLVDAILMGGLVAIFLFVSMGKSPAEHRASGDDAPPTLTEQYQFFAYFEPIVFDASRTSYMRSFLRKYPMEAGIAFLLIPWVWFALMEAWRGGSLGKLLVGIRVRRKDYGKVNIVISTIRFLGKIISTLILMLGYLLALFDRKRQALHDKVANTIVLPR